MASYPNFRHEAVLVTLEPVLVHGEWKDDGIDFLGQENVNGWRGGVSSFMPPCVQQAVSIRTSDHSLKLVTGTKCQVDGSGFLCYSQIRFVVEKSAPGGHGNRCSPRLRPTVLTNWPHREEVSPHSNEMLSKELKRPLDRVVWEVDGFITAPHF